jgi:hypothetical protein
MARGDDKREEEKEFKTYQVRLMVMPRRLATLQPKTKLDKLKKVVKEGSKDNSKRNKK